MKRFGRNMILAVFALVAAAPPAAAELRLTPIFGVSEDLTDNADETSSHRRGELLTVVQPGVGVNYVNAASRLDALYNLDYRYYAEGTRGNEISHTLTLAGSFSLVQEFLRLDISDTFSRVSLDIARDTRAETGYHDQTDQNTATVSPYFQWRFGDKTELKTGVRYTDIRYWTSRAVDRQESAAFAELNHQATSRLSVSGRYVFEHTKARSALITTNSSGSESYDDHSVSAGFRYEHAERSALFGTIGYSWQDYSSGANVGNLIWDAGISQQLGTFAVNLETKRRYIVDPLSVSQRQTSYSFRVDKLLSRATLGLSASYDEYAASDTGTVDRHGLTVALTGTRELSEHLTSSLTVTGDKLSERFSVDYPYHLRATGTLMYAMGPKTNVDFTYTHATYRYHLDQSRGSVDINRAVVQLRRTF